MVHSILAPPDRRFRRASKLVLRDRRPGQSDDAKTNLLWQFLRRSRACRNGSEFETLRGAMPNLHDAIQFRYCASSYLKSNMEAWLLADAPRTIITDLSGLSTRTIGWYSAAFFDIHDLLAFPDQVLHHVIRIEEHQPSREKRYDKLLKLIAYFGDFRLLHQVSHLGGAEDQFHDLDELLGALKRKAETELVGQVSMDAKDYDVNQSHKTLSVIGASADESKNSPQYDDFLKNVEEFLGGIKLTMASDALASATPEERQWMTGPHELRADEQEALARGEELPSELSDLLECRKSRDGDT